MQIMTFLKPTPALVPLFQYFKPIQVEPHHTIKFHSLGLQ